MRHPRKDPNHLILYQIVLRDARAAGSRDATVTSMGIVGTRINNVDQAQATTVRSPSWHAIGAASWSSPGELTSANRGRTMKRASYSWALCVSAGMYFWHAHPT